LQAALGVGKQMSTVCTRRSGAVVVAAVHAYHRLDGLQFPFAPDKALVGRELTNCLGICGSIGKVALPESVPFIGPASILIAATDSKMAAAISHGRHTTVV